MERLAELRSQLEMLAPEDRQRGREAIERIRQAQERIQALEEMLARAREREEDVTARAIRDRMRITDLETTIAELSAVAGRVTEAEGARLEAETVASESGRRLSLAEAELEAEQAEVRRLTARCAELEADLRRLADEVAAAAVARAEAERLQHERDVARERARTERRLAVEDRLRAAEAERRVAVLQGQLGEAERRITQLMNEREAGGPESEAEPEMSEPEVTPPSIEPQRTGAGGESAVAADLAEREPIDEDVIDLTEEEPVSNQLGAGDAGSEPDEVLVWTSPKKPGLFGRLLKDLWPEDEANGDYPEGDRGR